MQLLHETLSEEVEDVLFVAFPQPHPPPQGQKRVQRSATSWKVLSSFFILASFCAAVSVDTLLRSYFSALSA